MRLDYQLNDVLNNYKDPECGYNNYDHVRYEVWFSNPELLFKVNDKFNTVFTLETFIEVNEELYHSIKEFIWSLKSYIGTYGCEYLNPM